MKKKNAPYVQFHNRRGAAGLMVALLIPVFIGVAALGIDTYHNFVILSNELQNSADAGALAGAAKLYIYQDGNLMINDGTHGEPSANQVGQQVAQENLTTYVPQAEGESNRLEPEVTLSGNTGDVQRGHWAFGPPVQSNLARGFYPNASTVAVPIFGFTEAELDEDVNFINAVRVVSRREATPIATFFAPIFGIENTRLNREAVAYLGFAGPINPGEVDQPIAICEETITDPDGRLNCNIGRMINSGQDVLSHETGGWTDFCQAGNGDPDCSDNPCAGGTNATAVRDLVCADGNPFSLNSGDMATSGGDINAAFMDLENCWDDNTIINNLSDTEIDSWCEDQGYSTLQELIDALPPILQDAIADNPNFIRRTWGMTLPVISCPGNNVGTCENFQGAVEVMVAWINRQTDPQYNGVPRALFGPDCNLRWDSFGILDGTNQPMPSDTQADRINIWNNFASPIYPGLNLQNVDGSPAPYDQKSIYFLPSCELHEPAGGTGGENFGILAKIPVLVCPDPASHDPNDTNNCLGGQ